MLSADPALHLTGQVLSSPREVVLRLGRSGVHRRIDKQEHAGRRMPGERNVFLLGYENTLASTKIAARQARTSGECRIYIDDTLAAESVPELDLDYLSHNRLSRNRSGVL